MATKPFQWPNGKRAAVSISFDDGRASQLDHGIRILDSHGLRATFYVSFSFMEPRLGDWQKAAARGHEIGNHTMTHPCGCNFKFTRANALQDFTLDRMEQELIGANDKLEKIFGRRPTTFAYPCYERTVGRGVNTRSYVPLVAKHFLVGRGGKDEWCNFPPVTDLAQIYAYDADDAPFEQLKLQIEKGVTESGWIAFSGHEVGKPGELSMDANTLDALGRYCKDPANDIWFDTIETIGKYVKENRAPL